MARIFSLSIVIFIASCTGEDAKTILPPNPTTSDQPCSVGENGWTIPLLTIADGGVGKDGIPSIEDPKFIQARAVDYLTDEELISVVKVNGEMKAYPQRILDQHEVVNDMVGEVPIALTFCPLTGTAIAFKRSVENKVTTFGVSGILYNSNLVVYDRDSDTNWAQMTFEAVSGPLACQQLETLPLVELSWKALKELYPEMLILSTETGFGRNYNDEPLTSRINLNSLPFFPYRPKDERLPNYQRVHIILDSLGTTVYPTTLWEGGSTVIQDGIHTLFVSKELKMILSFANPLGVEELTPVVGKPGVILADGANNQYDLFGQIVDGPDKGQSLKVTSSYMGYWFAVAAMYPDPPIYRADQDG